MAKMPIPAPKKDMKPEMKDDLFAEELSLADDIEPESAIDQSLESKRMAPSSPDMLTPEEEDILKQAAEIQKMKKAAASKFLEAPEEEMADEAMGEEMGNPGNDEDLTY